MREVLAPHFVLNKNNETHKMQRNGECDMSLLSRGAMTACGVMFGLMQAANAAGGPDAFGYTFATSLDAGGPTAAWVDITATGSPVTGLADDNAAAAPIALPKAFPYYGSSFSSLKVGSNGWLSFNNVSNIASCFPTIPTAGGPDAYLAPYMSDLNFTGVGNPGVVNYYYDAPSDRFIVSYINVPYWSVNAPGWAGSNSFQVVLDYTNSSIRFNYLALSPFINNAACVDLTVGIESPSGTTGLQYASDANVPAPFSIVFTAPIAIAPGSVPNGTVAVAYNQPLSASGGTGTYNFSISAGSLPAGLTLDASGVLSGTPTAGGTFLFTALATDTSNNTGSQAYSLTIFAPAIALSPTTIPDGTFNATYTSTTITATGGTAPYQYSLTSGALPTGITLDSTGLLSGTPMQSGSFNITVTAQDSSTGTGPYTGSQAYSFAVNASTPVRLQSFDVN